MEDELDTTFRKKVTVCITECFIFAIGSLGRGYSPFGITNIYIYIYAHERTQKQEELLVPDLI